MKRILLSAFSVFAFGFTVCHGQNQPNSEIKGQDFLEQNSNDMKSFISLFEIPATKISRAIGFYQSILGINIEKMEIPGFQMGIFPYEEQMVTGVIVQGEGYKPSADGVTLYLNGGDNLQTILDKVEKCGGKIIVPKTAHADESGFFALFLDTEGNNLGLNSLN
jgi:hypothetical protein